MSAASQSPGGPVGQNDNNSNASPQLLSHAPSTLSRPFRSRKNRPCDACRKAKTRCAIPAPGPPCVECQQTNKQCTFDELPPVRKRAPPKRPLSPDQGRTGGEGGYYDTAYPEGKRPRHMREASIPVAAHGLEALMHAAARERDSQHQQMQLRLSQQQSNSMISLDGRSSAATVAGSSTSPTVGTGHVQPGPEETNLDPSSLDMSTTDVLEPHAITALLTDDLLPIGSTGYKQSSNGNEKDGHIRQISCDRSKPQYIIFSKRPEYLRQPPHRQSVDLLTSLLPLLHPPPTLPALVTLYLTASNPAFPLFIHPSSSSSASSPSSSSSFTQPYALLDPAIGAKAGQTALSHSSLYREKAKTISALMDGTVGVGAGYEEGKGKLAGISVSLLKLSARDKDVRSAAQGNYVALAGTIAQAQLLGLHIDSTNWSIPDWEKDLRRTLWWALMVHDAWMAFLNSRPSHVQHENTNVPLPTLATILHLTSPRPMSSSSATSPTTSSSSSTSTSAHSFILLCKLSVLVAQLQAQVCTLAAAGGSSNTSLLGVGGLAERDERLRRVSAIEESAATLLEEVKMSVGRSRDTGVVSLMTCLLGFRCMLRRIFIELNIGLGSPFTPDPETLDMYAEAVDYVCALEGPDFDGFWLTYVSHVLSSLASSLIRLSLATTSSSPTSSMLSPHTGDTSPPVPPPPSHHHHHHHQQQQQIPSTTLQATLHTNPLILLSRLLSALQKARKETHWEMADAALARAESVAGCLRPTGEFGNVVSALEGRVDEVGAGGVVPGFVGVGGAGAGTGLGIEQSSGVGYSYGGGGGGSNQFMHSHHLVDPAQQQQQQMGLDGRSTPIAWNIDLNAFGMDWMDGLMSGNGHGHSLSQFTSSR